MTKRSGWVLVGAPLPVGRGSAFAMIFARSSLRALTLALVLALTCAGAFALDGASADAASDTLARYLRGLEESLHQPDVRKSHRLVELIADDFVEYASAGCIYTKADLVAALQAETPVVQTSSDYSVVRLGPGAALLTYRIHRHSEPPVYTLRSSIWRTNDGRWQMVFHQATVTAAPQ